MAANRAALSRRPGSYPRCWGRRIQLADLGITYNVSTPLPVCPHLDCQAAGWEHVLLSDTLSLAQTQGILLTALVAANFMMS